MRKSSRLTTLVSTTTALIDTITTGNGDNNDNGSTDGGDDEPLEWWIIALAVGVSVLFIILVILTICLCRKRKQGKYEGTCSLFQNYFTSSSLGIRILINFQIEQSDIVYVRVTERTKSKTSLRHFGGI